MVGHLPSADAGPARSRGPGTLAVLTPHPSTAPTRTIVSTVLSVVAVAGAVVFAQSIALPNRADSLKFAAIGDNGTGDQPQYDVAQQMTDAHARFPFDLVIMLGDNLYG